VIVFLQDRFHPLPDFDEDETSQVETSPISTSQAVSPTARRVFTFKIREASTQSVVTPPSPAVSGETPIAEDMLDQNEDVIVRFNHMLANLKPDSSHIFRSLTPFERSRIHSLAEKEGLYHWTESIRPNKDKEYRIQVLIVSNKPEDRVRSNNPVVRKLIATVVQATTAIKIPQSSAIATVLAPRVAPRAERDVGPWPCPHYEKTDSKSKAGLEAPKRLKHKQ
jgi:hypothetical protein